jgi:hypothetical protein
LNPKTIFYFVCAYHIINANNSTINLAKAIPLSLHITIQNHLIHCFQASDIDQRGNIFLLQKKN